MKLTLQEIANLVDGYIEGDYSIKVHGAVRSPGEFDYGKGMSLRDALNQNQKCIEESCLAIINYQMVVSSVTIDMHVGIKK